MGFALPEVLSLKCPQRMSRDTFRVMALTAEVSRGTTQLTFNDWLPGKQSDVKQQNKPEF